MSLDVWLTVTAGTEREVECYHFNITHNLGKMASECGIYKAMWRPEEIGCSNAADIINILRNGIYNLMISPNKFKKYNPENGWGSYENLLEVAREYLDACVKFPEAKISVSR